MKAIWFALSSKVKAFLWRLADSKLKIQQHIEYALSNSDGVILQVGANDGISNDPLYHSIVKHQRESYLIEPVDFLADKLRLLHIDNEFVHVCQLAIHPHEQEVSFYHISKEAEFDMQELWKPWFDQLGSFSEEHLLKHDQRLKPYIKETIIPCKTLNGIITDFNLQNIAILQIDAEGYDLEVLSSLNLDLNRPNLIVLEHKHIKIFLVLKLIKTMVSFGYKVFLYHNDLVFMRHDC